MASPSADRLAEIAAAALAFDHRPPFSDQALVELRTGAREALLTDDATAAILGDDEAEFVVLPDARGAGHGTAMLEALLARYPQGLRVWAHGDHPAARALAASHGLTAVRTLLHLRAPVVEQPPLVEPVETTPRPVSTGSTSGGSTSGSSTSGDSTSGGIDHFRKGEDDAAWLALNARTFAFHPEQGGLTQRDLDQLAREPWFSEDDFLVARDGDAMIGYCWLKVEGGLGEFYVVGVDPERQGGGLGRRLMAAGFARLAERGIRIAHLYVEADNTPAVALYRSLGFTDHEVDVQYESRPGQSRPS